MIILYYIHANTILQVAKNSKRRSKKAPTAGNAYVLLIRRQLQRTV